MFFLFYDWKNLNNWSFRTDRVRIGIITSEKIWKTKSDCTWYLFIVILGHRHIPNNFDGELEKGDVTDKERFKEICIKHKITQIYHMAAILSATGEKDPELCWNVNLISYKNIFDIAVELKINKVFCASSMAVFGPTTPK